MFTVTGFQSAPDLTVDQIWRGLLNKAENPVEFVPAITSCRVLERGPDHLVREIVLRGERVRERVTFEPKRAVHFERLSGPVLGTIDNLIEAAPDGGPRLRFTFCLECAGVAPDSAQERAYAAMMGDSYLLAIRTTLATTRRLALAG